MGTTSTARTMIDGYLIVYNATCCLGWELVLVLTLLSIRTNIAQLGIVDSLANVYNDPVYGSSIAYALLLCQSAALLEIVHAFVKFVRSPVVVTTMQEMSRIVALVAIYFSTHAQSTFVLYFFLLVEIVLSVCLI